jgi:hypothetical protein
MATNDDLTERSTTTLGKRHVSEGRLGTYTLLGAAGGLVPLPWIPDAIGRSVRGALVHDVTARHGLTLTADARTVLVEPNGTEGPRGLLEQGTSFAVSRVLGRLGPLAFLGPARAAFGTFALGHLLHRYVEHARTEHSHRIDVEEARWVRRAIDQSLIAALTSDARASHEDAAHSPEELRTRTEQIVDGVLISMASMPGWLVRRIEAAFDEILASTAG